MPSSQLTTRTQLETERNNFLLHEQRIIQERDEILRNIHNHLEQLDAGKFYIVPLATLYALFWVCFLMFLHCNAIHCSLIMIILIYLIVYIDVHLQRLYVLVERQEIRPLPRQTIFLWNTSPQLPPSLQLIVMNPLQQQESIRIGPMVRK